MSTELSPKAILEGTRLTFKTEMAFALNEERRKTELGAEEPALGRPSV